MNRKLTVIVPFYNTKEQLFYDFVISIRNQTSKDFDVVIVDDGSDEEHIKVLKTCQDENIRIIYNEHHGVSHTRNTGILNTDTEYLAFADADDVLNECFVEKALKYINEYEPDIIYGALEYIPAYISIRQNNDVVEVFEGERLKDVKEALLDVGDRRLQYRILGSPVAKVYRTDLAKKTLFNERVSIYEDQLFNREILKRANKAIVVPDVWYDYIQHDASSIHKSFQRDYFDGMAPYIETSSVLDLEEDERIRNHMRMSYIRILYGSINKDCLERKETNYGNIRNHVAEMMNNKVIDDSIRNLDLKDPQIRSIDKINVLLLRRGIIYPVVLQKKVLNLLKNISLRKKES